ncbi:MAG: Tfp pilus assembly protein FimT/FimU [Bdellovibrionales bacterium]
MVHPTKPISARKSSKGFSLIEVLMVLAILGIMAAVVIPRLETRGPKMRRELRSITVLVKRLHHLARLNRVTYRLVIDMTSPDEHTYWVESSSQKVTFKTDEQIEEELRKKDSSKDDESDGVGFQVDPSFMKKPAELSHPLIFGGVELATRDKVIEQEKAYIHFLPQGVVEEASIFLTDKENLNYTIWINPLTGQADIISGKILIKDLRKK